MRCCLILKIIKANWFEIFEIISLSINAKALYIDSKYGLKKDFIERSIAASGVVYKVAQNPNKRKSKFLIWPQEPKKIEIGLMKYFKRWTLR